MGGPAVFIDDGALKKVQSNNSKENKNKLAVGVIIGALVDKVKPNILWFAPSPTDYTSTGSDPSNANNSKENVPLDLVPAHVQQIRRMVSGGLVVLGLYFVGNVDGFQAIKSSSIHQLLNRIFGTTSIQEAFIVSIIGKTIKCRKFDVKRSISNTCDYKLLPLESKFRHATCIFPIKDTISVTSSEPKSYLTAFRRSIQSLSDKIQQSHAIINETIFMNGNEQTNSLPTALPMDNELKAVFIRTPTSFPPQSDENEAALVRFRGCIGGAGFVFSKSSCEELVETLKQDIIHSLSVRIDILSEEWASEPDIATRATFSLLKRIAVKSTPWIGDYLLPNETLQHGLVRIKEFFGMEDLKVEDLVELESTDEYLTVSSRELKKEEVKEYAKQPIADSIPTTSPLNDSNMLRKIEIIVMAVIVLVVSWWIKWLFS